MIGGDGTARFIHTADWHLGRPLASVRLTDDQAYALEGLCGLVAEVRPDAVLISGDVYDRSVPPPEAVELLDDTLTRIAGLGAAVCVVAGNHDSPERIGFGARLLAPSGVHMAGPLTADVASVALPVRRDVRVVSGVLDAIVADAPPQGRDDYVFALLQDTGPLYDPMAALRGVWPNCIGFRRDRELDLAQGQPSLDAAQLRSRDVTALFSGFFQHVCGEDLTQTQRDTFVAIADAAASEGED